MRYHQAPGQIVIEKNIPIPNCWTGTGPEPDYPWPEMEESDSFWVPCMNEKQRTAVRTAGYHWFRVNEPTFKTVTRTEEKNGQDGIRIWKTAKIPKEEEDER